jgi:hypothetical protein
MKEKDIINLIKRISSKLSKAPNKSDEDAYSKLQWSEGYKEAVNFYKQIEVHAEIGEFPEELMKAKAPNETAEELQYRKETFESITVPYWHRAEGTMNRIWSEQNYKIEWGEDEVKGYFLQNFPIYGSVLSYFQSVVTRSKIRDPNAVLCLDFDLPVKETAEGEIVIDQAEPISPYATIYKSCDVLMFELGDFALFMSREKSIVRYGQREEEKGFVFYLYDTENIYRIEQVGEYVKYEFQYSVFYNHNLGYLPAWKLRGIPYDVYGDNPIYQSYFIGALPHLNKAVKLDSTLEASIAKVAYPIRAYYESKCNASGCHDGIIGLGDDAKKCGTCKGTGKLKFSPMRDFVQSLPDRLDPDTNMPFPAMAYVSPDSAILDFNKTKIREDIETAFTFINIDVSLKGDNSGEETATAAKIDRDELFVFLLSVSNELYSLLSNFVNAAKQIRFGGEGDIMVSAPKTFDLQTPKELTTELSEGKTAGIPNVAMNELSREYVAQRFAQNGAAVRVNDIVQYCDPYCNKSTQEIVTLKGAGIVQLWQCILHEEIISFIAVKLNEKASYLDTDLAQIKTDMEAMAKDKAAESTPNTATNLMAQIEAAPPAAAVTATDSGGA